MIWSYKSNNGITAAYNWGVYGVWRKQPAIVKIKDANYTQVTLIVNGSTVGVYVLDAKKSVEIDLSDLMAAKGNSGTISIRNEIGGVSIPYDIRGEVCPITDMVIPFVDALSGLWTGRWGALVGLPSRMISTPQGYANFLSVWGCSNDGQVPAYFKESGYSDFTVDNGKSLTINASHDIGTYSLDNDKLLMTTRILSPRCDRQYAAVQWVPQWGGKCVCAWEVRDYKSAITNSKELMPSYNECYSRTGYTDTMVLRLDNLTRYDYWYYSQLIFSQDIRVRINEDNEAADEDVFGDDERVSVVTKSVTQPNGQGVYTLEIEVTYRQYNILR